MSNPTLPNPEPIIPQIETIITDLLRIRLAAREVESLLATALGNATHAPEYEEIKRKVEAFQKALEAKAGPTDAELLNGLEKMLDDNHGLISIVKGDCGGFSLKLHGVWGSTKEISFGSDVRSLIANALDGIAEYKQG